MWRIGQDVSTRTVRRVSGLGPCAWTLFFAGSGEASVFSGGVANRDKATGVKVKAGATTIFDVSLNRGVTVTGGVFGGANTTRSRSAHVTFISADTNDVVGVGDVVFSTGGTSLANATVFSIPTTGSKTINVTMSQLDP
jgi:hypothetical protein